MVVQETFLGGIVFVLFLFAYFAGCIAASMLIEAAVKKIKKYKKTHR